MLPDDFPFSDSPLELLPASASELPVAVIRVKIALMLLRLSGKIELDPPLLPSERDDSVDAPLPVAVPEPLVVPEVAPVADAGFSDGVASSELDFFSAGVSGVVTGSFSLEPARSDASGVLVSVAGIFSEAAVVGGVVVPSLLAAPVLGAVAAGVAGASTLPKMMGIPSRPLPIMTVLELVD